MDDLIRILINLLFDNPFVALIVFGIVSFVLNKVRGAGKAAPGRGAMPPFGGGDATPPPNGRLGGERPIAPPNVRRGVSRGEPAGAEKASDSPAAPTEPAAAVPAPEAALAGSPSAAPGERPAAAQSKRQPAPAAAPKAARPAGIHARNAAQGMIWSEIYGPPRAVRPHRSGKR